MSRTKQRLEAALKARAYSMLDKGETHIKAFEVGFQEVIEMIFKNKPWYDVTSCNIFMTLLETQDIFKTIECIIDGINDETVTEMLHENDAIDFTIPADMLNDPAKVDFKSIMAKQRADHEAQKAAEEVERRKEELRVKYADLLQHAETSEDPHEELFKVLVPGSGACDTVAGELIRAISRIMYRDYNDGDVFYEGYGLETAAPAAAYLGDHGFNAEITRIAELGLQDDAYTKALEELDAKVVRSILDNPELLETPLDYDMWDAETSDIYEMQPRYEFDYEVSDVVAEYIDAGYVSSWDLVEVVREWLNYDHRFEDAEIGRPWGHHDHHVTIENLTKDGLEACEEWNRWNMWEDYESDLREEYGDLSEEDEDFDDDDIDESLKESPEVPFNPIAYLDNMPVFSEEDRAFAQSLVADLADVTIRNGSNSYLDITARKNDYIDGGIINVTKKFTDELRSYIEAKYPDWSIAENNTGTTYWFDYRGN
jgi:hypothetical protein